MTETALPASRPRTAAQPLIFLTLVGFVELILFVSGLAMGAHGEDILVLLLALVTVFVGVGPILVDLTRPAEKRQILITLVMLAYVIYLATPVFTNYFPLKGEYQWGHFHLTKRTPTEIAHAQIVALMGLATLLLGFYLPIGRLAVSVLPKPTREWPPQAAIFVAVIALVLGWLVYVLYQLGLVPVRVGSGALGTISSGSYFGISLLTLTWLRHRSREALLLLAIAIPLSMLFNFFTGSKRLFLTPPFMFALAYIVYERRIRWKWAAAGFAALVVLYPVSQFYRDAIQTDKSRSIRNFVRNPARALSALSQFGENVELGSYLASGLQSTGSRLDGLGVLTVIVRDTPERVPYQGGWTIGYIALSYVPRLIWPGKPGMTSGEWVSQTYGSPYDLHTDVGPTWVGELFFNWGYLGVAIGMFAMGVFCRALQEQLFGPNATIPARFAAVIVVYCVPLTAQGSLIAPVNGVTYHFVPILVAHYLVGLLAGFHRPRALATGLGATPSPTP